MNSSRYDDDPSQDLRSRAVTRLNVRRGFLVSLVLWAVVNAMLVFFWSRNGGFFWPIFPIVFWGLALFWQGLAAYGPGNSEDRIQREMRRLGGER